jgi:uncharacterized protein involved in copper resistance
MQGPAQYFFGIDAAIYLGEQGRTAARFSGEYYILLRQRLILQPELELQAGGCVCTTRFAVSSHRTGACIGNASSGGLPILRA